MEIDISKIYLVLSYNYQRYCDWCIDSGIDPHGPGAKFIHLPTQLQGYQPDNIVLVMLNAWYVGKSHSWVERVQEELARYEVMGAEQIWETG